MKQVLILKADYDALVYPAIAVASNEGGLPELRTQSKILDKLEAQGKPLPAAGLEAVLCQNCRAQFMSEPLNRPPPLFELDGISFKFEFEDAEAAYIATKLHESIKTVQGRVARNLIPIVDALEKELDDLGVAGDKAISAVASVPEAVRA